ncbi:hypothetical protein [Herbaspirillum sp. RV1423]|uniref:hypothetical protein n=1 Tax=Herbaspirillum sp. RV1423 TaxID=1443993 RepID=UPI0005552DD6|nr:hypothetical protein [Herbaspirillum sp. RV1423]
MTKLPFHGLFGRSTMAFAVNTLIIWVFAMVIAYLVGGYAVLNPYTAIGALAAPALWLLVNSFCTWYKSSKK